MVHGPVREVVRGPGPLDWSTDWGKNAGEKFIGESGLVFKDVVLPFLYLL